MLIRATGQYLESSPETASVAIYTAMWVGLAIPAFLSHPALGSPDDFCEDLRFIPLDAMCELTAARTTVDCSNGIEVSQATVGRYAGPKFPPRPSRAGMIVRTCRIDGNHGY